MHASGALGHFVEGVPAVPHAHADGGYLDFFTKVVDELEAGVSKVDEAINGAARDLLDYVVTRLFSNLRCHDRAFDLSLLVEPVPVELQGPLRDEVRGHVNFLTEQFTQVEPSKQGGGLDAFLFIST